MGDAGPQELLEVGHVVVAEHLDLAPRVPDPLHDRLVVELVRQHEAALAHEQRDGQAVGGEAHAVDEDVLDPEELRHDALRLPVQVRAAGVRALRVGAPAVLAQGGDHSRRAVRVGGGKAEVVVGPQVQAPPLLAGELQGLVPVAAAADQDVRPRPGRRANGPVEAVADAAVHPPDEEVFEVPAQRRVALRKEEEEEEERGEGGGSGRLPGGPRRSGWGGAHLL